jgi:hypothetical protein
VKTRRQEGWQERPGVSGVITFRKLQRIRGCFSSALGNITTGSKNYLDTFQVTTVIVTWYVNSRKL